MQTPSPRWHIEEFGMEVQARLDAVHLRLAPHDQRERALLVDQVRTLAALEREPDPQKQRALRNRAYRTARLLLHEDVTVENPLHAELPVIREEAKQSLEWEA